MSYEQERALWMTEPSSHPGDRNARHGKPRLVNRPCTTGGPQRWDQSTEASTADSGSGQFKISVWGSFPYTDFAELMFYP